jgi:D-xylose transport system substrate-binding protein
MDSVPQMITFVTPGGNSMFSILLSPLPITADNLDVVVTAEWISQEDVCAGVDAGSVAVCP